MQRLANAVELLDGRLDDRSALAGNLRDLRRINWLFGGIRLSERAIEDLIETDDRQRPIGDGPMALDIATAESGGVVVRLLDIGTGAGDIPLALVDRARRRAYSNGRPRALRVTAVDARPEVLEAAVGLEPRLATDPDIEVHVADGRHLPFADDAFDVAHASMVIHHLEPDEAIELLGEMRRVSSVGVVVNELDRSAGAVAGAWLVTRSIARNRFTRHDGPLSVRRSYRRSEMVDLLGDAGLQPVSERTAIFGHRYAIAAVDAGNAAGGSAVETGAGTSA